MEIGAKVAVVTGGGSGIGEALARRFIADGAAGVVIADRDEHAAQAVAASLGTCAHAVRCDVGREDDVVQLVREARERFGRVDVYVSNAGIFGAACGIEGPDDPWNAMWKVHVMAHVYAARAVLPEMAARGEGGFVVTASAAGLLNVLESAPYAATKHAAVGFAEWLRIAYGRQGIRVVCLCPQSVQTPMIAAGAGSAGLDGVRTPEQVAIAVIETLRAETFLCLPHPEVATYMQAKVANYDRWLGGMQKRYMQQQTPNGPAK